MPSASDALCLFGDTNSWTIRTLSCSPVNEVHSCFWSQEQQQRGFSNINNLFESMRIHMEHYFKRMIFSNHSFMGNIYNIWKLITKSHHHSHFLGSRLPRYEQGTKQQPNCTFLSQHYYKYTPKGKDKAFHISLSGRHGPRWKITFRHRFLATLKFQGTLDWKLRVSLSCYYKPFYNALVWISDI